MSVALYYSRVIGMTDEELAEAIRKDSGHTGEYYTDNIILGGNATAVGPKTRIELRGLMSKRLRAATRTTTIFRHKSANKRTHVWMAR